MSKKQWLPAFAAGAALYPLTLYVHPVVAFPIYFMAAFVLMSNLRVWYVGLYDARRQGGVVVRYQFNLTRSHLGAGAAGFFVCFVVLCTWAIITTFPYR